MRVETGNSRPADEGVYIDVLDRVDEAIVAVYALRYAAVLYYAIVITYCKFLYENDVPNPPVHLTPMRSIALFTVRARARISVLAACST